jgi:hypothetical protein
MQYQMLLEADRMSREEGLYVEVVDGKVKVFKRRDPEDTPILSAAMKELDEVTAGNWVRLETPEQALIFLKGWRVCRNTYASGWKRGES